MSNFSFAATAECGVCGAYLSSSSDEDCNHDGEAVNVYVFRKIGDGSLKGVKATAGYKWYALKDKVGGKWKTYEWLGTRELVNTMVKYHWDSAEDVPHRATAIDAPNDVWAKD